MKAMVLAAGLGTRMGPLTADCPKPLLKAGGKPLLQYHLEALSAAGVTEVIINLAYKGDQIRRFVGDGSRFGLQVRYSSEPEPLETGGAILQALPLLGEAPFLLVNGDVWCEHFPSHLVGHSLPKHCLGHLLLVPNPDFHPQGDFTLSPDGHLGLEHGQTRHTFAGISVLRPALIADSALKRSKFPLLDVLLPALKKDRLSGELYRGRWSDVGTPERLRALDQALVPG